MTCLLIAFILALMAHRQYAAEPRTERDIVFLGPDREEKLDAYFPPDTFERPVPAVLLIHGGGWKTGDKTSARERNIAGNLAKNGYAVFSINYLLKKSARDSATGQLVRAWPQNLYDCKSALRFIRAKATRYGIDPDRIAVMGGSAGGHLAMLVGATADHEKINRHGLYLEQSNQVSCILDFYGDYDLRGRKNPPFPGATAAETAASSAAASPVTYINEITPPMLIVHGTADNTVSVERSRALTRHLEKLGLDYWYVEIAGAHHSFHLQPSQMDLRPVALTFLAKHLGTVQ